LAVKDGIDFTYEETMQGSELCYDLHSIIYEAYIWTVYCYCENKRSEVTFICKS